MLKKIIIFTLIITILSTVSTVNPTYSEEVSDLEIEEYDSILMGEEESMTLSLEETIDFALENNLDMEIVRLELLKAEVNYKDRIRGIEDSEDNLQYFLLRDPVTNMLIPDGAINKAFIKNGGARRATELGLDAAKWNVEMKENQVKYNVEKAYYDLVLIEKELEIAQENFSLAQKQYDQGKLRYDLGMISQQQLLGLEFSLSQSLSSYDSAEMYFELQKMSFRNTIGLDFGQEFKLTDLVEIVEYEPIILEESIAEALENNGSLKISTENVEISELNLQALKVRYPENTYAYREQATELAKSEKNLETIRAGVEMQVRSAVLNLTTAEKQIATFEKAVFQASEGVRIAELSFELGQNTATEVAQANLNLMNAKKNLAQQIHAFNMALLDYKYSIGIGKGF